MCDGIICLANPSVEPEACAAYRTWFAPRPAYFVGPLLPDETSVGDKLANSQEKELNGSPNGGEVKKFLDTIQKSHGNHSLLYVCKLKDQFTSAHTIYMLDFVWVALVADRRWCLESPRSCFGHENSTGNLLSFSQTGLLEGVHMCILDTFLSSTKG